MPTKEGKEGKRTRGEIYVTDQIGHTQASGTSYSLCIDYSRAELRQDVNVGKQPR